MCIKFYIGQTGRDLKKRIYEHQRCITKADTNNALFLHMHENNHHMQLHTSLINNCSDYYNRNIIESALIYLSLKNNVNIHPVPVGIDKRGTLMLLRELNLTRFIAQ